MKKQTAEVKHIKQLTGKVVSTKMQKTVVVEVMQITRHPLYQKPVRKTRRFAARYMDMTLAVGDEVRISETKPFSKTVHFQVVEKVLKQG